LFCKSPSFKALLLALALGIQGPAVARAQSSPARDASQESISSAERLFQEGREAMRHADYETARERFESAYRLEPALGTILNLALCNMRLGRLVEASQALHEFLDRAPEDDDRRPHAMQWLKEVRIRMPRLQIRLAGNASPSLRVLVDGAVVSDPSAPIAVNAGSHTVTTEPPVAPLHVVAHEGETTSVAVVGPETGASLRAPERPPPRDEPPVTGLPSPALPATPATRAPSGDARRSGRLALGLTLGAVGIAAVVTGTIAGLQVIDDKDTVQTHCDAHRCDRAGLDAIHSGRDWSAVSTVAFATSVAAVGASLYFTFTSDPHPQRGTALPHLWFGLLAGTPFAGAETPLW
jgi:hypothetical protein